MSMTHNSKSIFTLALRSALLVLPGVSQLGSGNWKLLVLRTYLHTISNDNDSPEQHSQKCIFHCACGMKLQKIHKYRMCSSG